jgi:Xaa-Pro aminopeptidase
MQTVHPSIMIGSYGWEQDRVPRDEFQIRLAELNRIMDSRNWKAMFLFGDAREHSALAYFTNFVPRLRWALALLPREGEPRLLVSMSSRDMPAMRLMTWIPDVMSGWTWESAFDPWLAHLRADAPVDIGTLRFDLMRPPLFQSLQRSLGDSFRLHAADAEIAAGRLPRPRELSQVREAGRVVAAAAAKFVAAWRDDSDVEAAALEGEHEARLMAAQDVRTLVSFDDGRTLAPYRGAFATRCAGLLGYIAVKHMGYWAEMFVYAGDGASDVARRAQAGLDAALQAAGPGISAADLYAKAVAPLDGRPLHPVLCDSIGRRIGFSLNEGDELRRDSRHVLRPGEIYALHVGAQDAAKGGAIASAMIVITPKGSEILVQSSACAVA